MELAWLVVHTLLASVVGVLSPLVAGILGVPQTKPSLSRVSFFSGNHHFQTSTKGPKLKVGVNAATAHLEKDKPFWTVVGMLS